MTGLRLGAVRTKDAHRYWSTYLEGRTDAPTRSLADHVERYLALSLEDRNAHLAFWDGDRIVGTVRLLSGALAGFSMAASHEGRAQEAILRAVDALRAQGATSITASYEDRYERAFEALGFRREFARVRMEAPTRRYPPPGGVDLRPPEEREVAGLTRFLMDVYEGHMEQRFGMHVGPEEEWRGYVAGLLKGDSGRFMPDASFVSLEADRITGAVLTTHWMGAPLVAELGVAKDRRRRGLGRILLHAASDRLAALQEPRISLYVTVGNDPAVALYRDEGFSQVGGQSVTGRLRSPDSQG